jgi:uncharacterized protein YjeT (DUF2065 family)
MSKGTVAQSLTKSQVLQDTSLTTLGAALIAAGMGLATGSTTTENQLVGVGLCVLGLVAYWMKYSLSDAQA